MGSAINVPDLAQKFYETYSLIDELDNVITADRWTVTATNGGGLTRVDGQGAGITLDTADSTAADNDETYFLTTQESFKFIDGQPLYGSAKIQFAEADTDAANIAVGFANAVAANTIQDDGAGPPADYSGAVIYKVDGGTKWIFETSVGTTQTTTTSTTTAGGATAQKLEIHIDDHSPNKLRAIPLVDGVQLVDANNNPIAHYITLGSPTEMNFFAGVKQGSATEQTLTVKKVCCLQKEA
jgi:hypothetical protein